MGLYASHMGVPVDVVMGGVTVLNQGRVLCTGGSEQDCWHPAPARAPGAVGGWDGVSGLGARVSPTLSHLGAGTCRVPHARASSTSRWTR